MLSQLSCPKHAAGLALALPFKSCDKQLLVVAVLHINKYANWLQNMNFVRKSTKIFNNILGYISAYYIVYYCTFM